MRHEINPHLKIAIAGFGVEGKASYSYYSQAGADITIVDEKAKIEDVPEGVKTLLGEGVFEKLHEYDLVIRSPQINPARIITHGKIWSATNEFFEKCPVPIIGVTGTKGKGTTSTLISTILEAAGHKTWLVGNIGVPALEVLDEIEQYAKSKMQKMPDQESIINNLKSTSEAGVVVFELSSFQLWDIERSPQTAVILMIEPDHMDVHASMDEYVNAKRNITYHQTKDDLLVHHPTNKYALEIAEKSQAKKAPFMKEPAARSVIPAQAGIQKSDWIPDQVWDDGKGEWVIIDKQPICKTSEVGLLGVHNLENICAAITASWHYTQDVDAIKKAVVSFKGLPHRLEFVRELNGVKYFDDSYSSAPSASIAAIKSFVEPEIVILGGFDRGLDLTELIEAIIKQANIKHLLLIGDTRTKIANQLRACGFTVFTELASKNLSDIVKVAHEHAQPGDVVILTPGCPSFDMFKNFEERGDIFKKSVREIS